LSFVDEVEEIHDYFFGQIGILHLVIYYNAECVARKRIVTGILLQDLLFILFMVEN